MTENKIRDSLRRIFNDVCDDLQLASSTLKEYCEKNNLSYMDATHGSLKTDNDVLLRKYINRFFMANGEVEGVKRTLNIFYTNAEIDMFYNDHLNDDKEDDDDKSSFDSTSQALYGRRYEEVKRAEKAYERSKRGKIVDDMQDAIEINAH